MKHGSAKDDLVLRSDRNGVVTLQRNRPLQFNALSEDIPTFSGFAGQVLLSFLGAAISYPPLGKLLPEDEPYRVPMARHG